MGWGPAPVPPGASAWPVLARAGERGAADVVRHPVRHAVLDQRDRAPSAVPSASKERGSVRGDAGESAMLMEGAATCSPSRPARAPRPSACARPLNAHPAEQVHEPADRLRREHHRILAGRGARPARRRPPPSPRPARPARGRGVAPPMKEVSEAYPLRPLGAMQMTFMNASVRRSERAAVDGCPGLLLLGDGPDAVRLDAVLAGRRRRPRPAPRPPAAGASSAVTGSKALRSGRLVRGREAGKVPVAGGRGRPAREPRSLRALGERPRRPRRWSTPCPRAPGTGRRSRRSRRRWRSTGWAVRRRSAA